MYPTSTQNILVGLDLSSMDHHILSFLGTNAQALTDKNLQFIHVDENPSTSDDGESLNDFPDQAKAALLKERLAEIKQSIPASLVPEEVRYFPGKPEAEIKKWSESQHIDLLVVGKKPIDGPGVEVKKLVKKAGSSLLLVPEKDGYAIDKICVAVDFSALAKVAVKEAHQLAQRLGAKLLGFHAYQVPSGYHKTGKSRLEFAKVMEENARKEAEKFLEELGIGPIDMHYHYDQNNQPAQAIAHFAQENAIDLLVAGSKGRTNAASVVMGSVAKAVTKRVDKVPILILKEKNKNMHLLDALKEV